MNQSLDACFNSCKGSIGHDTRNHSSMHRAYRKMCRGVLPGIRCQSLQTQGNATALWGDFQHLDLDLFAKSDDLVRMQHSSP